MSTKTNKKMITKGNNTNPKSGESGKQGRMTNFYELQINLEILLTLSI